MRLPTITLLLLTVSCASSNLGRSWVSPDAAGKQFKKLGVVALTNQEVYRREAEWALVQELGERGLASYQLLDGLNSLRDTANVVRTLQEAGCDGIVTLQLKSGRVRPDPAAAPSSNASVGTTMDDYWVDPSAQQAEAFLPGQFFSVEVHVFDMAARKMVYNGLAIEQDARNTADLVHMVRRDVMDDLRQKGVVSGK
ncbi:MAG: hypothetical protein JNL43_12065 [Flavobacteriales bacterium]|nr:hypothetical protein [Flavobacteriales bacterium]HRH71180.1 hypothetical protein [Flavobacteriales bacterium]